MIWAMAFAAVALAFVWVTGVNDGAALLGLSGRYPRSSGPLLMALVLVPLVLVPQWTVAVARTFTEGSRTSATGAARSPSCSA